MRPLASVASALVVCTAMHSAGAQVDNPARHQAGTNQLGLSLGVDTAAQIELSYARALSPSSPTRPTVTGRLQLPTAPVPLDGALSFTAQLSFVDDGGWGLQPALGLEARRVAGPLLDITQLSVIPSLGAGIFRPVWMAALEASWDRSFLTVVSPSDAYRQHGYAGAKGGVLGGGGGLLRLGLRAAVGVAAGTDVGLRVGYLTSERLEAPAGLPFYALLGATQRF